MFRVFLINDQAIIACNRTVTSYRNRLLTTTGKAMKYFCLLFTVIVFSQFSMAQEKGSLGDKAYIKRGKYLLKKGKFDEALIDFNEAIRINPKNISGYIYRGILFEERKDYDLAILSISSISLLVIAQPFNLKAHSKESNNFLLPLGISLGTYKSNRPSS